MSPDAVVACVGSAVFAITLIGVLEAFRWKSGGEDE